MPRKPKPKSRWPPLPRRAPGTGSIQRLPDDSLRARMPATVDPKRTAREFPADGLKDAQAWLAARLRGGTHTPITPLGEWTGYWWKTAVEIGKPTTARLYLVALKDLAPEHRRAIGDLKPAHFQALIGPLSRRLAPATLAVRVSIWRTCLEAAVDNELIGRNPVRNLKLPKPPKRGATRRGWTEKESLALWAATEGTRFEVIFKIVLGCGLRIAEVLALAWENVDLGGHRIWVEPQYTGGIWRDEPKGDNPHWISIPQPVMAALIRHHDRQRPGTLLVAASPHKRAPRSASGKARLAAVVKNGRTEHPWSYSTVRRDFLKLAATVGISDRKLHGGRHALGSFLIEEGISPPVVAEILGHADAGVTLGTYAHATDRGRDRARELIDRLFGGEDVPAGATGGATE